jgi:competence protein ComEC
MRAFLAGAVFLAASAMARPLEIYFIDVEGGQATLVVSPSGQSLLIDAGFSNFSGRDADRIAVAARAAHVKKIDYVLISHHHSDHEGGVPNLLERLQVGMFFDPGPTVETSPAHLRTYRAYEAAMAKQQREVIKPGAAIPVKGIEVTVVAAGGQTIDRHGETNPFCAGVAAKADENGENARSAGVVVTMGKFRFANLGDLTWNKQLALLCPENRAGKVDVLETPQHGAESPSAIFGLAPRVVVMNNGARDGPKGWKRVNDSKGLQDLWQLHFAVAGGQDANAPDTLIANVDEPCEGKYLKLSAEPDGSFTMYNSRNKYTKAYAVR